MDPSLWCCNGQYAAVSAVSPPTAPPHAPTFVLFRLRNVAARPGGAAHPSLVDLGDDLLSLPSKLAVFLVLPFYCSVESYLFMIY